MLMPSRKSKNDPEVLTTISNVNPGGVISTSLRYHDFNAGKIVTDMTVMAAS
jgi:hypothetical protein